MSERRWAEGRKQTLFLCWDWLFILHTHVSLLWDWLDYRNIEITAHKFIIVIEEFFIVIIINIVLLPRPKMDLTLEVCKSPGTPVALGGVPGGACIC